MRCIDLFGFVLNLIPFEFVSDFVLRISYFPTLLQSRRAKNEMFFLSINRDSADTCADTLAADAELLMIVVKET